MTTFVPIYYPYLALIDSCMHIYFLNRLGWLVFWDKFWISRWLVFWDGGSIYENLHWCCSRGKKMYQEWSSIWIMKFWKLNLAVCACWPSSHWATKYSYARTWLSASKVSRRMNVNRDTTTPNRAICSGSGYLSRFWNRDLDSAA